ncbi:hypothetical protein B1757_05120, partial [Acidithiobacillus marinus]
MSLQERFDYMHWLDAAMVIDERIKDRHIVLANMERQRYFLHCAGAEQIQETHLFLPFMEVTASNGKHVQSRSFGPYMQGAINVETMKALAFTPETAALLSGEALELLSSPNCPSDVMDILLSPAQMTLQIHESIGHPLELDRILGDERNYAGWSFVELSDFGKLQYGSSLLNVLGSS